MDNIVNIANEEKREALIKSRNLHLRGRWNRILFMYVFFMAFPAIIIIQNISIYIFGALLFFLLRYSKKNLVSLNKPLQWLALIFGFGALLSVLNIPSDYAIDNVERALSVLPNYLYWSLLIIVMVHNRHLIDLNIVYKAVFWGTVILIVYYLFLQNFLVVIPVFALQSPNNFAFLMICFSPIAVYYLFRIRGKLWALGLLMIFVLILLIEGRRAGMVLVLLGGLGTLFIERITFRHIFLTACLVPLSVFLIYTDPFERFVFSASERIHQMIYETDKIRKEDPSYLTRVAMVNKGLTIFEQYPYTGIGLNNFSNFTTKIDSDFEGAEFVIHKADINRKSAHNSYISLLAEGGLFLLVPFLLILGSLILFFLLRINSMPEDRRPIFWGVLGMSVHLYFISAIVNVFAWFLIGLACAIVYKRD